MDAQRLLLEQYDFVAMVSTGMVYAGLQGDQLRLHPQERQNSLAWLLWHATRWEDVVVNTWVAGQPQVLDRQDWLAHLRVPDRHCGTAMTPAEAAQVSAQVDLDALRAYREAVEERTRAVVTALRAEDLDEMVDTARLQQSVSDGTYGNPRAQWMDDFWANHTKGWFLAFVNTHNAEQLIAEAICVRSLGGFPLGI